ncbi:hypothetical protein F6Q08_23500 [Pectobacterium parmentieri]|nr:hypothetical protein [Pectobacterium parmentieri]
MISQQPLKYYNNSYNSKVSLPVLISTSDADDADLMRMLFIMAVGYYQGTIRWYNSENVTTESVMAKFIYK